MGGANLVLIVALNSDVSLVMKCHVVSLQNKERRVAA